MLKNSKREKFETIKELRKSLVPVLRGNEALLSIKLI